MEGDGLNYVYLDSVSNENLPYTIKPVIPKFIKPALKSKELYDLSFVDGRCLTNKMNHGYFEIYSLLLESFRLKESINLVELGIGSVKPETPSTMYHHKKNLPHITGYEYSPGGSLLLWKEFFKNTLCNTVGWDIDIEDSLAGDEIGRASCRERV